MKNVPSASACATATFHSAASSGVSNPKIRCAHAANIPGIAVSVTAANCGKQASCTSPAAWNRRYRPAARTPASGPTRQSARAGGRVRLQAAASRCWPSHGLSGTGPALCSLFATRRAGMPRRRAAVYGGAGNLQPTAQATRFHSGAALVVRSACAFAYPSLILRGALTSAVTAARSSAMAVVQSSKLTDMRASIDGGIAAHESFRTDDNRRCFTSA